MPRLKSSTASCAARSSSSSFVGSKLLILQPFGCEPLYDFVGQESRDGNTVVTHFEIGCRLYLLQPTQVQADQVGKDFGVGFGTHLWERSDR